MTENRSPLIIATPQEMQAWSRAERRQGRSIAFVPTMGYLHEGHKSLLDEGRKRGERLVLSIFVNPTQFGPNEDLSRYPRDMERDTAIAVASGVDVIYYPDAATMYPADHATSIEVSGVTAPLCGASRPGHFTGVATVVAKLFNIVLPDIALFGSKDFQQLAVIRRMVADLNFPIEIIGMPIVRDADGLAMSSRNVYLSPDQRVQALSLIDAIRSACRMVAAGETDPEAVLAMVRSRITREPDARIDYAEIRQGGDLLTSVQLDQDSVLFLAVKFGATRLIDNHLLSQAL